jgi:hypothetical protein
MKRFISACMIAGLCAFANPAFAQTTAKQDTKRAGEQVKDAGKDAGAAAKDAGKATAKATKKAAKSTKRHVKGTPYTASCKDGTTYSGKTRKDACAGHGGVKAWT